MKITYTVTLSHCGEIELHCSEDGGLWLAVMNGEHTMRLQVASQEEVDDLLTAVAEWASSPIPKGGAR